MPPATGGWGGRLTSDERRAERSGPLRETHPDITESSLGRDLMRRCPARGGPMGFEWFPGVPADEPPASKLPTSAARRLPACDHPRTATHRLGSASGRLSGSEEEIACITRDFFLTLGRAEDSYGAPTLPLLGRSLLGV